MYFATITSQGQLSIPAKIRKELKLNKNQKVTLEIQNNKVIISPISNFSDLAGGLSKYGQINKNKNIDEIIQTENQAISEAAIEHYQKNS